MIARTLWHDTQDGRVDVSERELLARTEPLIVLGEAGMGKSTLMEALGQGAEAASCTARALTSHADPRQLLGNKTVLVIDALDEVPANRDGDAVDRVLEKLSQLGHPRFILSCRVAEWRGATARDAILGHYEQAPLELHMNPFDDEDARRFLASRNVADTAAVIRHFDERGLSDFLGNPQTLDLIAKIADNLPDTRRELFARAIDVLGVEANDKKADAALAQVAALLAGGATCAALILGGFAAVVRKGTANTGVGELALADAKAFVGDKLDPVLDTRLFKGLGSDRYSYWHRSIGEYLAATWLAARADSPPKRKRLLTLFQAQGLVPASLRGLHAWLALDPHLADAVISADPMGVITYGDADGLTVGQGRAMIAALRTALIENPAAIGWGNHRALGLVQPELHADVEAALTDPSTPLRLRQLLIGQLPGSAMAAQLAPALRAILLDPTNYFAMRSEAGGALAALSIHDWPQIVATIRGEATHDATRLAMELIDRVGHADFSDHELVETIFGDAGLLISPLKPEGQDRLVGKFGRTHRLVPDDRLDTVLDLFCDYAAALLPPHGGYELNELIDLAYALILRRIDLGVIDPLRLWRWLQPFKDQSGYRRNKLEKLQTWVGAHDDVRRAIQRHVLLDEVNDRNIWQRAMRLSRRTQGLSLDEGDVVALLAALDSADRQDERWREILRLTYHDGDKGAAARATARAFAAHRPDLLEWLDKLADPQPAPWEAKQAKEQRRLAAKQAVEWAAHRQDFGQNSGKMTAGDYAYLVDPARAYLNRFRDIGEGLPPHERVEQWLGTALAAAAHTGFEAFLTARPPVPNAVEIAKSAANSRIWNAGVIIVAALAERHRTGRGFADLSAERLMAGYFELDYNESSVGIDGLREALADELRRRDKWRSTLVLKIGPYLANRNTHVTGLYELMRGDANAALAAQLAEGWLTRYPDLPGEVEFELIDRLIRSDRSACLIGLASIRIAQGGLDDERRRNWDAVQLLVDFDAACARLSAVERELLWHVRARAGDRNRDNARIDLSVAQLRWLIDTFRPLWPNASRPNGVTSGDTNVWDASDYVRQLIARLGDVTSDEAVDALAAIRAAPDDGYSDMIRVIQAEQRAKKVQETFVSPTLAQIDAVLTDAAPASAIDLRVVVLDLLATAQAKIGGGDTDTVGTFWQNGKHLDENTCRDRLVDVLGLHLPFGITAASEVDMPGSKRADIGFTLGQMRLPVEVKGQWHKDLWSAADDQLDALYGCDWLADRKGIYLVLWVGTADTITRHPDGLVRPATPEALRTMLVERSRAARSGDVEIRVLDLTRRS